MADGKRPNGLSLIPWQVGKSLTCDITTVCPLADSYVAAAAQDTASVAELTAAHKSTKYIELNSSHTFQSIAIESLGPINDLSLIHI